MTPFTLNPCPYGCEKMAKLESTRTVKDVIIKKWWCDTCKKGYMTVKGVKNDPNN